jgi:hypothetical protein
MHGSERWFSLAYGIWLFGFFAYFVPAATWNPVSRFDLTRAMVELRTVSIDEYVENTGDRAFAGGHWYTDKAPIPSVLAVPAYAVFYLGQRLRGERPTYTVFSTPLTPALRVTVNGAFQRGLYVCSLSTAGVGTAVLGVLLFRLLLRRFKPRTALVASGGTILATPLFPYATSFYGHAVAAVFLVGAYFALFGDQGPSRAGRVRIAGACLGLAVGCEYIVALPALVLGVVFLASRSRRDAVHGALNLAAGALFPIAFVAAYHSVCFGAPWRTGYSFLVRPEFVKGHASGFMGLHLPTLSGLFGILLGRARGLFFLAPVTAVALVFAIRAAWQSRDAAFGAPLAAFVTLLSANAGYYMWWGGAAAGPRHLVPVLGFLAFGLAAAWESRATALTAVLLAVSLANVLVLTGVGLEAPDHVDALFSYAYRRLADGDVASLSGASNLGIRLGLSPATTLVPVVVWLAFGARFLLARVDAWISVAPSDQREDRPGAAAKA